MSANKGVSSHWIGITTCFRPACSQSDSCPLHGCRGGRHGTRNHLEVKLPQAEKRRRDVAGRGIRRSHREPHQSAFRHANLANCERRSFVKGHRHAGDHRSVGMRVVLREDRVVSPQPRLSRIGRDETRLTSMRQVWKALPHCTCSKRLVQNASARMNSPLGQNTTASTYTVLRYCCTIRPLNLKPMEI
jgi:hypothetical protein